MTPWWSGTLQYQLEGASNYCHAGSAHTSRAGLLVGGQFGTLFASFGDLHVFLGGGNSLCLKSSLFVFPVVTIATGRYRVER
jgi:hypothetical protein